MRTYTVKTITIFFFLSFFLSGCVENYDLPEKTKKGKSIYDAWHNGIDVTFDRYIDIAFAFNAWFEADTSMKNDIEDISFPLYKIRDLGNDQWGLYYNTELAYRIHRNNKPLSAIDAVWVVEAMNDIIDLHDNKGQDNYSSDNYTFDSYVKDEITSIRLSSTGMNQWDIQIVDLNISIRSLDTNYGIASLSYNPFVWKGKGVFFYQNYYGNAFIEFETKEDIVCRYRKRRMEDPNDSYYQNLYDNSFYWSTGKVSLTAIHSNGKETVSTDASFSPLANSKFRMHITYKGITEEWIEPNGY